MARVVVATPSDPGFPCPPPPRGQSRGPGAQPGLVQRKEEENAQEAREKRPVGEEPEPRQAKPGPDATASDAGKACRGRQTHREGWKAAGARVVL